jgi:hypothetical protein
MDENVLSCMVSSSRTSRNIKIYVIVLVVVKLTKIDATKKQRLVLVTYLYGTFIITLVRLSWELVSPFYSPNVLCYTSILGSLSCDELQVVPVILTIQVSGSFKL